jgi:hypothetical protein
MEDQNTQSSLEMRIMELENQLRELREAQQSMSGQMGAQAAIPCGYCGYCYCGYCYCYVAGGQQQAMSAQASLCIPCSMGTQAVGTLPPVLFCRIPCLVECICGPCNVCTQCGFSGGGFSGGGGRFGGLGG